MAATRTFRTAIYSAAAAHHHPTIPVAGYGHCASRTPGETFARSTHTYQPASPHGPHTAPRVVVVTAPRAAFCCGLSVPMTYHATRQRHANARDTTVVVLLHSLLICLTIPLRLVAAAALMLHHLLDRRLRCAVITSIRTWRKRHVLLCTLPAPSLPCFWRVPYSNAPAVSHARCARHLPSPQPRATGGAVI